MGKEFDVIVIGELNVDLIMDELEGFPEQGKEKRANRMTLTLGSSSAIFASNISSLGTRVAFIGRVGNDKFGEIVLESLQKSQVDVSGIMVDEQVGTGVTVICNVLPERAGTTYAGAMEALTIGDISEDDLNRAKHLHFSSYYLQTGMQKDLGELFRKAQRLGLTTSFDMQWDPREKWDLEIEDILPHVNIFLPNEQELIFLTGKSDLEEAIGALKKYTDILAIKRGSRGSVVCYGDEIVSRPAFPNRKVVDPVGAGDSFNAGFIYKYLEGASIPECQEFGNLMGAISTTAAGGTGAFQDSDRLKRTARDMFGFVV